MYHNKNELTEDTFRAILINEGFKYTTDLEGIELALVRDNNGDIMCPYLDGEVHNVSVESDCLLITDSGKDTGDSTYGTLQIRKETCDHCDCDIDLDDYHYSEITGNPICETCYLEENYVETDSGSYPRDECKRLVIPVENEYYWELSSNCVYVELHSVVIEDCFTEEGWYTEDQIQIIIEEWSNEE
jgi:hypothetical protein